MGDELLLLEPDRPLLVFFCSFAKGMHDDNDDSIQELKPTGLA